MKSSDALTVWQLDPAQTTPYYNLALCRALGAAGCRVRYLTTPWLDEDLGAAAAGVSVSYVYATGLSAARLRRSRPLRRLARGLTYPLGHLRVLAAARAAPPDILHIQWPRLPLLDRWLVHLVRRRGVPVVLTAHDVVPLFNPASRVGDLAAIYTDADAVITHAEADRAAFLAQFPSVDPARVHIIPQLAPFATQRRPDLEPAQARVSLGLPPAAPTLLFCGTVRHYKGLDTLAAAWPLVLARRPDAWLIVAGQPEELTDAAVQQRIRALPHTVIHAEYLPSDDLGRYHRAADLAVFPYHASYTSGALVTALQFGCPVVATTVGGLPETVDGAGWLVPPRDPAALADAAVAALEDPAGLAERGRRALAQVAQRHAPAVAAEATLALYGSLLAAPRPASTRVHV